MSIHWQTLAFSELTTSQLYAILQARSEVFVVEQNCPYLDADGADLNCHHLSAWNDESQLAAYLRVVPPGLKYPEASLGRVITTQHGRGQGLGKQLLVRGIAECQRLHPQQAIRIGAQHYLEKFYQSFGFVTVSDIYLEDDIPHVEMLLSASTRSQS
ncbi:GNAT family N-acetyltransferase [Undibacterium cyanobacteriorum]|uniref:GNAT family N-acetyltransferase n=1 Tax=Undibacterium cyanobacteriorum TaxID=3073561 RepID=A0ABY9RHQ9_9BURK|nr:GNAT family N-acetyltransferase [Undibacterium sp. 20NA77.5]WMW79631.1 GNAT family N-acetyltransferase [Undibacterium sp. 20NA77.5]